MQIVPHANSYSRRVCHADPVLLAGVAAGCFRAATRTRRRSNDARTNDCPVSNMITVRIDHADLQNY